MIFIFKHIFPKPYVGLSLWPVIILKHDDLKNDPELLNHERIHLQQQKELLVIPFYLIYFLEWAFGLVKYRSAYDAYKNISFEREAYVNENNPDYLKERRFFGFFSYFFNNRPS